MSEKNYQIAVRQTRFPVSLFFVVYVVLLLMSGIHMGFIYLMNALNIHEAVQTVVPMIYWAIAAAIITMYTRWQMKRNYETPVKQLAKATAKVAAGDFSVYVKPLHTPDKLDYLDVMLIDFNTMVEELGSIETLKTDFFSNVSHEIKTPLAAIQNYAELLENPNLCEEKRMEYVKSIRSATKRLSSLITNMLKLNKLEGQAISPVAVSFDLPARLCQSAIGFEKVLESKGIELEAELEDALTIKADPELLDMVWNNLLSNAYKFTQAGGTIKLCQTSTENTAIISVADTGCGMSKETLKYIFEKFYQGDTSHATDGNGLGLALVVRVVDLMNGKIEVESTLGEGSTFTVTLPLRLGE